MKEVSDSRSAILSKVKELGQKNKALLALNEELRDALEFTTGLCKKCDENTCPIHKALRRSRGEAM